ncbi:methyltransferase [Candidatus Woesearchaeota archaeon]|nr:methyltransferase [Candidatus Woesearchaeota archaeon]
MNKKQLAIKLSKLKGLEVLNPNLEQYQTNSEFASELLWLVYQNEDIEDKYIADFGCGNGLLGIGALLLGAKFVYFLDLDENALEICKNNVNSLGFHNCKFIHSDVYKFDNNVDIVVMNPPFGVQKRKADKTFLEVAMKHSKVIYSIHKIESKNFIQQLSSESGFQIENVIERDFIIKRSFDFHNKDRYNVKVGIWILRKV